jgi:mono/diheme cytochrome c family protein
MRDGEWRDGEWRDGEWRDGEWIIPTIGQSPLAIRVVIPGLSPVHRHAPGASRFLTIEQIKDVVAYLMSPDSPVNK